MCVFMCVEDIMDWRVGDTGWVISGEGRVRNDVDGDLTYEVLKKKIKESVGPLIKLSKPKYMSALWYNYKGEK